MSRRERDSYLTPEWATRVLLESVPELGGTSLVDPTCGDGRMAAALGHRFKRVALNDIGPGTPGTALDATSPASWRAFGEKAEGGGPLGPALQGTHRAAWVVTNPPFNAAGPIAYEALQHARLGVALLLRCTFLEPCAGRRWLAGTPPTRIIALPRISFTGDGKSDSAATWWFIWLRSKADGPWLREGVQVVARAEGAGQLALAVG